MPANKLSCFKAYDIRGRLGEELNIEIAERIGAAFATTLNANWTCHVSVPPQVLV